MRRIIRRPLKIATVAAMLAQAGAGAAGACPSIPKVWIADQIEDGMRRLALMAELPEGCTGRYQISLQREQNGNRNASSQGGMLPEQHEGPVLLSSLSVNEAPGASLTIEIEVLFDDGMVLRQSLERPAVE